MARRHAVLTVLLAAVVGCAAIALRSDTGERRSFAPGASEITRTRDVLSFAESPSGVVEGVLGERTERIGEIARAEHRNPQRNARTFDWAVSVVAATAALAALALGIARRRPGHLSVSVGRLAPSRAPPVPLFT